MIPIRTQLAKDQCAQAVTGKALLTAQPDVRCVQLDRTGLVQGWCQPTAALVVSSKF